MLNNLIKVALRHFWNSKLFSLINIIGLSVGIACFFLIMANVQDEYSYDNFHENKDRLYRLALERIYPDNVVFFAITPHSIAEAMLNDFPEVEDMTRFINANVEIVFKYDDKSFEESRFFLVEPNFFDFFTLPLLKGEPESVFSTPNSLVMTQETAVRYFGDDDPIGKQVSHPQGDFIVSGVCADVPKNSHLEFDFLVSAELAGAFRQPNFVAFDVYAYLVLKPGTKPQAVEEKMPGLVERYAAGPIEAQTGVSFADYTRAGNGYRYFLQPIQDIHLRSHLSNEIKANGNILYVYLMIAIALFVILIAVINFMNLATAQSASRAREVGIRKIIGSTRLPLVRQFLTESLVMGLASTVCAAALIQIFLPVFNQLEGKQLDIHFIKDPLYLVLLLAIGIAVGLLAGIYPSFVLSAYQPSTILKGKFARSRKGIRLRNGLVVFQFALSIILISMTLLVSKQIRFMTQMNLGFDSRDVAVIERANSLGNRTEAFKQEILNIPGVAGVGGSTTLIQGGFYYGVFFKDQRDPEVKTTRGMTVDYGFLDTLKIRVVEGRGFSKEYNESRSVIINRSAQKELGWSEPVGMSLFRAGGEGELTGKYTIIGVVDDFHYNSLHEDIDSFVFFTPEGDAILPLLNVRIHPDNTATALAAIEKKWDEFVPQEPFSAFFLDDELADLYKNEQTSGRIFLVFSVLAVLIACIGLFGLSSYTAEQRTKEIGVRKALGSTAAQVVFLLSKDYSKLVLLAFVVALPLAALLMLNWLSHFAYRVSFGFILFAAALLITLFTAFIAVSYQSVKAARTKPAESLRYE